MSEYDQSYDLIKKSRHLYFEKGSLRRYCLRDEIANAWIKYNLLKEQDLIVKEDYSKEGAQYRLLWDKLKGYLNQFKFKPLIIMNHHHIFNFAFDTTKYYYATGPEISQKLRKDYSVFKSEHISDVYDDAFTHGFCLNGYNNEDIIIGIYGAYNAYSKEVLETIKKWLMDQISPRIKKSLYTDFIDIEAFYQKIDHHHLPVLLIGKHGTGKSYFVRRIQKKYCPNYDVKVFNCHEISDIEKCFEIKNKTILYFKNIEWLSYKEQRKLVKVLDSKLVNRNSNKSDYSKRFKVFISTYNKEVTNHRNQVIDERLLTRLTANILYFKPVKQYGINRIIHLIESNLSRVISSEVKSLLAHISWENNLYDLKKLLDFIQEYCDQFEIETKYIPLFLMNRNVEIKSIEEMEKSLIQETINFFEDNITLASESLGVSRSTLYRKLKKYKINID